MHLWWVFMLLAGCTSESDLSKEKRLQVINQRVESLQKQINTLEKSALHDEVEGLESFRGNYVEFAKEYESSEVTEEKAKALQHEIDQLLAEKKKLESQL